MKLGNFTNVQFYKSGHKTIRKCMDVTDVKDPPEVKLIIYV